MNTRSVLVLVTASLVAQPVFAHVCNVQLSNPAVVTQCGDPDDPSALASYLPTVARDGTVSFSSDEFTGYGWISGTNPTLGDSHVVDGGKFYVFDLSKRSKVTIAFANDARANATPFDPAFTLYSGTLPYLGHDDAAFDPLNPVDEVTFLPVASPTDTAPGRNYHYCPLDKWRDTKRYTQTGGLDSSGNPLHPFVGQFNALNDWSLANENAVPATAPGGDWSTISYVAHQNQYGKGKTESLTATLPAGRYTIAAGGANCNDLTQGSTCQLGPFYTAVLSLKVQ